MPSDSDIRDTSENNVMLSAMHIEQSNKVCGLPYHTLAQKCRDLLGASQMKDGAEPTTQSLLLLVVHKYWPSAHEAATQRGSHSRPEHCDACHKCDPPDTMYTPLARDSRVWHLQCRVADMISNILGHIGMAPADSVCESVSV